MPDKSNPHHVHGEARGAEKGDHSLSFFYFFLLFFFLFFFFWPHHLWSDGERGSEKEVEQNLNEVGKVGGVRDGRQRKWEIRADRNIISGKMTQKKQDRRGQVKGETSEDGEK